VKTVQVTSGDFGMGLLQGFWQAHVRACVEVGDSTRGLNFDIEDRKPWVDPADFVVRLLLAFTCFKVQGFTASRKDIHEIRWTYLSRKTSSAKPDRNDTGLECGTTREVRRSTPKAPGRPIASRRRLGSRFVLYNLKHL
jgi:hypothetical protein